MSTLSEETKESLAFHLRALAEIWAPGDEEIESYVTHNEYGLAITSLAAHVGELA